MDEDTGWVWLPWRRRRRKIYSRWGWRGGGVLWGEQTVANPFGAVMQRTHAVTGMSCVFLGLKESQSSVSAKQYFTATNWSWWTPKMHKPIAGFIHTFHLETWNAQWPWGSKLSAGSAGHTVVTDAYYPQWMARVGEQHSHTYPPSSIYLLQLPVLNNNENFDL